MQQRPTPAPASPFAQLAAQLFRKPQFLLPLVVVAGILGVAFGVQPGGGAPAEADTEVGITPGADVASPSPSPSLTPSPSPSPQVTATASATGTATSEVAGARSTASASASATATATADDEPDYTRDTTQCGSLQETAVDLGVEQKLSGVSVRAQKAAVYPIEYFRCILMATGGREAVALAGSILKAENAGATHAVLIDLWITNSGRDFGQVNLKTASIAAAGQTFSPLATLGGRAEVVISSGQGRNVTLVGVLTNSVGATTGPMTVTIDAPLVGGSQTAGKYQLFLPTP
ncbi:MAG: hypothetical protein ACM3S1_05370 [Hyphomicrobiales bacterium]